MKTSIKLFCIGMLPICLLCMALFSRVLIFGASAEQERENMLAALSTYTMGDIHRFFAERFEDMTMLANEPVIRSRRPSTAQITATLLVYKKHFKAHLPCDSLSFFDLKRATIADTEGTAGEGRHGPSEYRKELAAGKEFELFLSESEVFREKEFQAVHLVKDENGTVFGVLVAKIPVEALRPLIERPLRAFKMNSALHVDLLDKNGLLLYSTHNKEGILRDRFPEWDGVRKARHAGAFRGRMLTRDSENGEEMVYFPAKEEGDSAYPGNDWTLMVSSTKRAAFAPVGERVNWILPAIIVLGLLSLAGLNHLVKTLARVHAELRNAAEVDAVTGIFTRHKIERVLALEMERAKRYKNPLSVVLFGLDHYETVNDASGAPGETSELKTAIAAVRENIGKIDAVGRWGGNEFIVVAAEMGLEQAGEMADKIMQRVETVVSQNPERLALRCGYAEQAPGDTPDSLMRKADAALHKARQKGKKKVDAHGLFLWA